MRRGQLGREDHRVVGEGLELQRVAARVLEEHRRLLPRLAGEADVRLDPETHPRRRDAIRAYERALPSDQDGGLHYQLAKLYVQEADRAKAAEHYKLHIAEHAPEHEGPNDNAQTQEAREFLARWFKEQRQFAEAIRQVQQLQQGIPGRPKDNADALMAEILADQARVAATGER